MRQYISLKMFLICFSVYVVVMVLFFYNRKIDEYRSSEWGKAVVVDILTGTETGSSTRGSSDYTVYYPQFSLNYKDSTYLFADRVGCFRRYKTGDSALVYFNPENISEAKAFCWVRFWISTPHLIVSMFVAAFIFFLIVIWNQRFMEKLQQNKYR